MSNTFNHKWSRAQLLFLCTLMVNPLAAVAQKVPSSSPRPNTSASPEPLNQQQEPPTVEERLLRPNYVLGPGDQIVIHAFEAEDLSDKPFRIDGDGNLNLPLIGRIKAAGQTVQQLEAIITKSLAKYFKEPQVTVMVAQFRSAPVFFVGAFKAPGIYPLQGQRTLVDLLSSIGGLQPNASRRIKVTRRKEMGDIPLPNAVYSPDQSVTTVEISMGSLRDNVNPAEDIIIKPFDVISVERAEMVYAAGEVGKVGGIELNERESVSVLQLLAMVGGATKDGNLAKARILRPVMKSSRRAEIPVNIHDIYQGKAADFPLLANDMLYIPQKAFFTRNTGRILIYAVPIATTIIVIALR